MPPTCFHSGSRIPTFGKSIVCFLSLGLAVAFPPRAAAAQPPTPTPQTAPETQPPETEVQVEVLKGSQSQIPIGTGFAGLSYEKGYLATGVFAAENQAQVKLFKRLGPSVFRIGANQVTSTYWNASAPGKTFPEIAPSDIDRLAAFLRACDWRVIYAVNHALNTSEQAAEEASYAAKSLGDRLLAFEIGNEPDLYRKKPDHPERPRPADYSYENFHEEWKSFADAIKKSVPNAALVGPSTAGEGKKEKGWLPLFAKDEGARIAMLTQHYYIRGAKDPASSVEDMLTTPEPQLARMLGNLKAWVVNNGIKDGFHLNEANSYWGGGKPGLCDSHASALWVLNFLFTCAQNDACRGVSLHGGNRAPYTPIAYKTSESELSNNREGAPAKDHLAIDEIRPEYYGLSLFSMAAEGWMRETKNTSTSPQSALLSYAIAPSGGGMNVVLVNTSATARYSTRLKFGVAVKAATLFRLTGDSLESTTSTRLAGAKITTDGEWDPVPETLTSLENDSLRISVPPFSAVLIKAF